MNQLKQLGKLLLYPRVQYRRLFGDREDGGKDGEPEAYVTSGGQRLSFRDFILNPALLLGGLIVFGLFAIVLFGPLIAPINPYIGGQHVVSHYDSELEVWVHPPLEPSEEYPLGTDEWGNDILSMLLYGARNTLVLCAFITMVRIVLGLVIGAYAGWNEGKPGDQVVMGVIGVLTAIPMLISSMIIIYALDIRRGLPVFIIALSIIGWTEIAQYIRSEFLVIRKTPYIEGAYAVGARNITIAVRHVLPNILPKLLVITFLEIGAVLILLGELGFVGVYIGGGSHIATGDEITGINVVTLSEVPEWGA
ncbi:MAG: ABC transporter permease, partial [Anaerolineales bacterium]|nr:ABC transporter permease [Anaerolineales bacterium]